MIVGSGTRERTYQRDGRSWTRWTAWVEFPRDPKYPKRRNRRHSEHATERLANAWIRAQIAEEAESPASARSREQLTVGRLLEDYLEHGETVAAWSPSHARNTRRQVEVYLKPLQHALAMGLQAEDVDELIADLVRRRVSKDQIRQIRNALRAAFNLAIRRRRIPQGHNPAAIVDIPRTTRRAPKFVPPDQLGRFIQLVQDDWLGALYLTCAMLALRPSEALALRWADVELDAGTVHIERSVHRVPGRRVRGQATRASGGHYEIRPTKNHAARTVHAPPWLMLQLRNQRQRLRRAGMKTGADALVFPAQQTGDYVYEPHARTHLAELLEGTPLEGVTMYQLRHTGITLRGFGGVPLEVIQEEAGHSNINQTRRYQQLVDAQRKQSADALEALLAAAQQTPAEASDAEPAATTPTPIRRARRR